MSRLAFLGFALVAARVAAQGTAPEALPPLVFDDLSYAAAEWVSLEDRPLAERSVFGRNPWCTSLACPDTLVARAWYRYLWGEAGFPVTDSLARLEPDTSGTGALGMALLAGVHPPSWAHQLASGFSQRTGVWATRVRFSMDPETPTADMIQAFWTLAPHEAVKAPDPGRYRGTEKGRVELDFEWNNWFDHTPSTDLHLSSAAFLNSEAAELLAHRASPGAAPFTCRLSDGAGRERTASPPECVAFLSSEGVWTTLLIRAGASGIQFEVQADGAQGRLRAASAPIPREPSQRMMLMLSQHLFGVVRGGVQGVLPRDERVVFDWVYVSPRPDRSLADVLADVATIQAARVAGRRIARLRTTPVRLERPYRPRGGGLERYAPPAVRIEGPQRIAPGQAAEYVARLDDVIGTFRLDWSERPVWPDGHAGDWTVPDAGPAYRYPTRMPRRAACLDLRVDVVTMQYTPVDTDEGRIVEWVP